jgi:hypothetical protein
MELRAIVRSSSFNLRFSAEVDPPEGQHNSDSMMAEPKHSAIGTNYIPIPIRLEWKLDHA